jgi:TP901 family phage tail tape measure protein
MGAGVDVSRIIIAADSTQVRTATSDLDGLARQGAATATATGNLEGSIKKLVIAFGGFAAVTAYLRGATDASLEFSTAMGRVSTVMDKMSDMPAMRRGLKEIAEQFGKTSASQAAAMYDILSAGISDTAKALDMLTMSNKLALGGVTDVGTAADGLTTIMMAFGDQVKSTQDASDAMFVSAAIGKTTIEQLSHTIGRVAPIAANAGISLQEMLGAIGALTAGGINTHQSVDGLRAMLQAVIKPSDDSAKMAKRLGMEFNLAALQTKGFAGFIADLRDKTKGNTEVMAKLMGGVEAIVPAMALTGNGFATFTAGMERMSKMAGETESAVSKMADTPQYKIDQLKTKMSNMLIETGDKLVRWLAPMAEFGTKHFAEITNATNNMKTAIEFLIASKLGSWIGSKIVDFQAYAAQMTINRAHTLALIEDEVRTTAAALASAQADQAKVIAKGAVNASYIAQIGYEKQVRTSIQATTLAAEAHEAATVRLATAGSVLTRVKVGLNNVLQLLGGWFGVASMAALGLYMVINKLNEADENLRDGMTKTAIASGDVASKTIGIMTTLKDQFAIHEKATKGSAEYENSEKKLAIAKKELMALGPEYRDALNKEVDTWEKMSAAITKVNQGKLAQIQADKAKIEKAIDKPELSTWQAFKSYALPTAYDAGEQMRANQARDQKALNDLTAQEAVMLKALLPLEEKKAEVNKINKHIDESAEKEIEQLERYTKGLEHQARIINLQKFETYALDDNYKKLTGSMKKRADAAIMDMTIKEGIEAENKAIKKQSEEFDNLVNSLMPEAAEEEKYLAALYRINQAIEEGIGLNEEEAEILREKARLQMTTGGKAEVKHREDMESYAKELRPEDELIEKMGKLKTLMDGGRISASAYAKEQEKLLRSLDSGFDLLVTSVETASGAMGDAFVKLALTGKASMKDMTNAMLQDLARLMANKAMAQLLNLAVGALMGAWGGDPSNSPGYDDGFEGGGNIGQKAAGGNVIAGSPYLVGEKRPELFVPSSSGTIIPAVGGGAPQISIAITVNADGSAETSVTGGGEEQSRVMAEAIGIKIRRTIQEECAPGGDIYQFVNKG